MENLDLKLAYLAGLFDGEGTITLSLEKTRSFRYPVISMSSTSRNLLELCKETFGGHISTHKTYQAHHKQSWSWKVSHDSAIDTASQLLSYLHEPEKRRRITLLLSTYKSVTKRNGKYDANSKAAKLAFEHEFFHPSNSIANALEVL